MKPIIIATAATIILASCQSGQVNITSQDRAAGIAALSSVLSSAARQEQPEPAAIEAARAALDAYTAPSAP